MEGLTRTLAREYGPWHIRVNCIIPGWIMTEKQLTEWVTPEAEESIMRNQCLPDKVYPDDVARLLLWLAADDSHACTAQNGAHWCSSVRWLTVATWTQHWVSRSSIIVFMSMKGLTVTRSTRSPSSRRIRSRWPGSLEAASVARVPMPRSQPVQMSRQIEDMLGWDSEDCSESRSSSD